MIIKQKLVKYNTETKRRETYLDDREFYSLQEIKDYFIESSNRNPSFCDVVCQSFVITDTNEEIRIFGQWCKNEEGSYYIELDYDF